MKNFRHWLPLSLAVLLVGVGIYAGPSIIGASGTTYTATAPIVVTGSVISSTPASASASGYLNNIAGVLAIDAGFTAPSLNLDAPGGNPGSVVGLMLAAQASSTNPAVVIRTSTTLDTTDAMFSTTGSAGAILGITVFASGKTNFTGDVSTGASSDFLAGRLVSSGTASGSIAFQQLTGSKHCLVTGGTGCSSSILGVGMPQTDQSADCDNAATGNAPTGKVCIQAGQGSMVLTNSSISTSSIVMLTSISDDATCLGEYITVGAGSATIGCIGIATATANTVVGFAVFNP